MCPGRHLQGLNFSFVRKIKKKLAYISTIVIFCYYQLAEVIVINILGVICLDRGAISALAIGALSPRNSPPPPPPGGLGGTK